MVFFLLYTVRTTRRAFSPLTLYSWPLGSVVEKKGASQNPSQAMLAQRTRIISAAKKVVPSSGGVVYWMSRDQRAHDNWALLQAQHVARTHNVGLCVVFCLVPTFLEATQRQYGFMLRGLSEVEDDLRGLGIPFKATRRTTLAFESFYCALSPAAFLLLCVFAPFCCDVPSIAHPLLGDHLLIYALSLSLSPAYRLAALPAACMGREDWGGCKRVFFPRSFSPVAPLTSCRRSPDGTTHARSSPTLAPSVWGGSGRKGSSTVWKARQCMRSTHITLSLCGLPVRSKRLARGRYGKRSMIR